MNSFSSPQWPTTVDASVPQPAQFSILDVTDSVARDYHYDARNNRRNSVPHEDAPCLRSPELAYHHHFVPPTPEHGDEAVVSPHVPQTMLRRLNSSAGSDYGKGSPPAGPSSLTAHQGQNLGTILHPSPAQSDAAFAPETLSPTNHRPDTTPSSQQTEHAASQLLSLGQMSPSLPSPVLKHTSAGTLRQTFPPHTPLTEPDSGGDGLFIEGSAYLDLHSTLRHSLIQESLSAEPTRCATPSSQSDGGVAGDSYEHGGDEPDFILTKEQEGILWVNWLEEVAPGVSRPPNSHGLQHPLTRYLSVAR